MDQNQQGIIYKENAKKYNRTTRNHLVNETYTGSVNADGTVNYLPPGWSVGHGATGNYTINHKLGHTSYTIVPSASTNEPGDNTSTAVWRLKTATSFSINTIYYPTPADRNYPFDFIVVAYNRPIPVIALI